jgi:hypothetical protein
MLRSKKQRLSALLFHFLLWNVLAIAFHVNAQSGSPVFRHFTTEDGLPSSEVYFALQDAKGYMWFATDHGVARFNGYEFQAFTTKDGLSDNTVFKLFEDRKGRIWMLTFSGKIFYFENDTIHSYKYNHLVNKTNENIIPLGIFVEPDDAVHISFLTKGIMKIDSHGNIGWRFLDYEYTTQKYFIDELDTAALLVSLTYNDVDKKGHPVKIIYSGKTGLDTVYFPSVVTGKFNAARFSRNKMIYSLAKSLYESSGNTVKFLAEVPFEVTFLMKEKRNDRLWVGTANGVYCYDNGSFLQPTQHYLETKSISGIMGDREGGYWFTTLEDGIYYLPGDAIHGIYFAEEYLQKPLCLAKGMGSTGYAGYRGGALVELKGGRGKMIYHPQEDHKNMLYLNSLYPDTIENKIYFSQTSPGYFSDGKFHLFRNHIPRGLQTNFLKRADGNLFCSGSSFVFKKQADSLACVKVTYQRINCLFDTDDHQLLLGCNSGALIYNEKTDQTTVFNKELNDIRVTDIQRVQNNVCFSTRGKGVLFFVNGKFKVIDESKGLCSDLVTKLFVKGNDVWCATNSGVSRIQFSDFKKFVFTISNIRAGDGLLSDEIKDIMEINDTMYVATKSGISFFDKNSDFINHTRPQIEFTSLQVNNSNTGMSDALKFSHNRNNIKIGFAGISHRSNKKIMYHYKLLNGADTLSEVTANRDVEFLSLRPGHYTFMVAASNSSGIESEPARFSFFIQPAWWQTWWFKLLLAAGFIAVVYIVYRNQLKKLREKFTVERTQASLHLTALRAQMNPHFIFNIMNSIRQYMQNNNSASAEKYLSSFAKHLRNTLDNSEVQEISLEEEIDALKIYAELEMQGIENGFEFEIQCDKEISLSETMLPSLLLQPFVENAIKHGIHGMNGKGKITVCLKQIEHSILIVIEDNGIGREEASKQNLERKGKHISHGTRMAFDRIEAYNKAYNKKIKATIVDLTKSGKSTGTRVEIRV